MTLPRRERQDAFLLFGGTSSASYTVFLPLLHDEGLVPLVVDLPETSRLPGPSPAEALLVDPGDLPALFGGIRAWSARYRIAGLHNTIEAFVEPAALAGDYLGLPGPGLRAARVCRNKLLQRTYCADISPAFDAFRARAAVPAFDRYPAILKPAGRRGGSGVVAVDDLDAVERERGSYQQGELLLLEERIFGRDFSIETLVQGGRILFENVTEEREDPLGRPNLEMGYTLPAIGLPALDRAYAMNRRLVSRLRFEDGMLHAEYKITKEGRIVLIEAAARNPGDGLLAMYHLSTGRPIERAVLDIALGRPTTYGHPVRLVRQVYLEAAPGTLERVDTGSFDVAPHYPDMGPAPRVAPDGSAAGTLREVRIEKMRGEVLGPLEQADDRVGSVLFDAASVAELDALERRILDDVRVVVTPRA